MPYTNSWDDSLPLGTAFRHTVDDLFRQLKNDIHERMNAVVVDWTADPVVPVGAVSGLVSKRMEIDPSAFLYDTPPSVMTDKYIEWDNSVLNVTGYAPLIVASGVTLYGMLVGYQGTQVGGAGPTVGSMSILGYSIGTDTIVTIANLSGLSNLSLSYVLVNFSHNVDLGNSMYKLKFTLVNPGGAGTRTFRLGLVSLLYTSHSNSETL